MAQLSALKRSPRWPRAYAEREVSAWHASGQSKAKFARTRGYPVKRLAYWIDRLRGRAPLRDAGRSLVPVRLADAHSASDASSGTMRTPIEVELRNGVRVRVHADFDDQVFRRVLAVAGRC